MNGNTDASIEALYEGADREIIQSQGEQMILWEEELQQEVAKERDAHEDYLESIEPVDLDQMADDYDEMLAEQERNYVRELLGD